MYSPAPAFVKMGELFRQLNDFERPLRNSYRLLPFRLASLGGGQYVAANEAGEFIKLGRETLEAFVRHKLCASSAIYETSSRATF
jgi:hypothetical protein